MFACLKWSNVVRHIDGLERNEKMCLWHLAFFAHRTVMSNVPVNMSKCFCEMTAINDVAKTM